MSASDRRRAARNRYLQMSPEHLEKLVLSNMARVYEGAKLLKERDLHCPLPLSLYVQIETFLRLFEEK